MSRGQKITHKGTRNRFDFVAGSTGGHLNIVPEKGDVEVKIPNPTPTDFKEKDIPKEVAEQLDAVGPGEEKLEGPDDNKINLSEGDMRKATGDVKPDDKGFAKASPNFKEVDSQAKASVEDEKKAIESNTIVDEKEDEDEDADA